MERRCIVDAVTGDRDDPAPRSGRTHQAELLRGSRPRHHVQRREIGAELTSNPIVRKISFTGSTEVGKILMAQCASTVKKLSLELGGNAPFIVFDDADLDAAVEGAIISKYRNTGQTCVCANRFLVHAPVYDAFADRLDAAVGRLKVGPGLERDVTQGPLIDDAAVEKVEAHVRDAVQKGATVVRGGHRSALGGSLFWPLSVWLAQRSLPLTMRPGFH